MDSVREFFQSPAGIIYGFVYGQDEDIGNIMKCGKSADRSVEKSVED